ncbi:MAG: helix-turn-helix transcriptional regulator [Phycisphaerae bacterium]|nr:helix-turn-helix transcriptional regulator [Phycisphaerae bacterium]
MLKSIHTPEYREFCRRLVTLREAAGLSQRALAQRLRVSPSWVAKAESAERRMDLIEFARVCEACGADASKVAGTFLKAIK